MRLALVLLMLVLPGCAGAPKTVVQHIPFVDEPFEFNGRLAVKQGRYHDTTGVHWTHRQTRDDIILLGPLGYTIGRIHSDANGATLEDVYGQRNAAVDAETLMQKSVGWAVPLTGLRYWLVAAPAPEGEFTLERNPDGQVSALNQQGWEIRYPRYATAKPDALPLELNISRDGIEAVLKIDEWMTP